MLLIISSILSSTWQRLTQFPFPMISGLFFLVLLYGGQIWATNNDRHELGPAGGKIQTILVVTPYVDNVICGTGDGRIFHSSNRGETWSAASVPLDRAGYSVETIIAGRFHETLWAGIRHEDGSGCLWRSLDAGRKWTVVEGSNTLTAVRSLLFRHRDTSTLFAGTTDGLFRSDDEGSTWQRVFLPSPNSSVASLEQSADGMTILLGTWRRGFRSTDGGKHFKPIWNGMTEDSHIFTFVRHPLAQGVVYAATCGWVYRSHQYGDSWSIRKQGLDDRRIYSLALIPTQPEVLIAGTADGIFTCINQETVWRNVGLKGHIILSLAVDPINDIVYAGLDGAGIYKSIDRGKTFYHSSSGMNAAHVATIAISGSRLAGIVNLAASRYGMLRIDDIHSREQAWVIPLLEDIGDPLTSLLDHDEKKGQTSLFVGTFKGLYHIEFERENLKSNKTDVPGPVTKLIRHPQRSTVLFATGFDGLYRSTDSGVTWHKNSPGDYNGQAFSVAVDSLSPDRLYLGTLIGLYRSDDLGKNWRFTSHNLPKKKTTIILDNPKKPGHVVALSTLGLYASSDVARSWGAMPAYDFPRHASFIFRDPRSSLTLLANDLANGGLHYSLNEGMSWAAFSGLADLRINTCVVAEESSDKESLVLLCATSGNGLVRLIIYAMQ